MRTQRVGAARQRGMASIIITMFMMVVVSLIVLGFATLSRREQRQSLDQQLSAQAFYAAETGIEDAARIIRAGIPSGRVYAKEQCTTNTEAGATYPTAANGRMTIDEANQVSYTCLMVDPSPRSVSFDEVGANDIVVPIRTEADISRLEIAWSPSTPAPAGQTPGECPNGTANVFAAQGDWDCHYGLMRMDLVPSAGALSRTGLAGRQLTGFFVPSRSTSPGTIGYQGSFGQPNATVADCDTDAYRECRISVTDLGQDRQFVLRLSSLYRTSNVRIMAYQGGTPLEISGAQVLIDATGKARDVLRRVQVRMPVINTRLAIPGEGIRTTSPVCKRFSNGPGYFSISAEIHADNRDPGNAMCRPFTDACRSVRDIVIVADESLSMAKQWQTTTRMNKLKDVIRRFIAETSITANDNHAALIGFSTDGRLIQGLTGNAAAMTDGVNRMAPIWTTNYLTGLNIGDTEIFGPRTRAGSPKVMIFISDGAPKDDKTQIRAKANDLKSRGVQLYTIAVGDQSDEDDPLDEQLMRDMAGNGGSYNDASSEASLDQVIQAISDQLSCN